MGPIDVLWWRKGKVFLRRKRDEGIDEVVDCFVGEREREKSRVLEFWFLERR